LLIILLIASPQRDTFLLAPFSAKDE